MLENIPIEIWFFYFLGAIYNWIGLMKKEIMKNRKRKKNLYEIKSTNEKCQSIFLKLEINFDFFSSLFHSLVLLQLESNQLVLICILQRNSPEAPNSIAGNSHS